MLSVVKVVFHRSTFPAHTQRVRYARLGTKCDGTTEIRSDRPRKMVPGGHTRLAGLAYRVLAVGYEGQEPVIHVAR